tara:strand:+ start:72 stop:305 length:234 start_codon:yes stop_codon:yes gene_type:complete
MSIVKNFGKDEELKNYMEYIVERDKRSLKDKSRDIIKVEDFSNNDIMIRELFNDIFYESLREFFSKYIVDKNKDNVI